MPAAMRARRCSGQSCPAVVLQRSFHRLARGKKQSSFVAVPPCALAAAQRSLLSKAREYPRPRPLPLHSPTDCTAPRPLSNGCLPPPLGPRREHHEDGYSFTWSGRILLNTVALPPQHWAAISWTHRCPDTNGREHPEYICRSA